MEHDLIDRDFRLFAEECDQMQGIQIMTSTDDAWGGFASEYVAALRDEYSKASIVTWGLEGRDKVPRVSLLSFFYLRFAWKFILERAPRIPRLSQSRLIVNRNKRSSEQLISRTLYQG
jgi:hypothetical protein